jgi:hypothetical protein
MLVAINMNRKYKKVPMKSTIPLSAVTVLAALALIGCATNRSSKSTEKPSAKSSVDMPATNTPPHRAVDTTDSANDATR